tara:strand:- start:733 stop:1071 length:339 start_codon:yes stop_codon:yes gene_type:complete
MTAEQLATVTRLLGTENIVEIKIDAETDDVILILKAVSAYIIVYYNGIINYWKNHMRHREYQTRENGERYFLPAVIYPTDMEIPNEHWWNNNQFDPETTLYLGKPVRTPGHV